MQPKDLLNYFASYIEAEIGIIYADHNFFQLQNRLEDISKFLGLASVEALFALAQSGITGHFRELLLDLATNNETSFFRDLKVFKNIEAAILPQIIQKKQPLDKLKIWSAASSTGQESISLAILLLEYYKKSNKDLKFNITATDISSRVIKKAQSGKYTQFEVQRGLPAALLIKYFNKNEDDSWQVKPEISALIDFKNFNLKDPFLFAEKFDLILCRNILIYQSIESKKEIIKRMTLVLAEGGFLVLGAGESLIGLSDEYERIISEDTVFYRKKISLARVA